MFRGLFIGIDRYAAPVTRLSCAVADATALGALFEDSIDGQACVLRDDEATAERIRDELIRLQSAAEDDNVIVSFSGHGTEDHRVVPIDVDPTDLEGSCIALTELATALDAIPSHNMLVFLDCCFSGGFGGARVFAPTSSRAPLEDRADVEALVRGKGRIVITASGAGEPALETLGLGHGLLTHYLMLGLQGAEDLADGSRVELLPLFHYVMRQVGLAAAGMHEVQTPTLYGTVEGAPALQVLHPGARYAAAFPGRVRPAATEDWASLASYGLPGHALTAWAAHMPGLNALQLEAINSYGVLDGRSLLVVAPTGAGKTMIGEMTALQAVGTRSRAVMLLPLRALVNDKYDYMQRVYGDALTVIRATGEHSDQVGDLLAGQFDIALLTYEKFSNVVLASPYVLRGLSVVIVDEVQMLSDPSRGANLEFLLTILRSGMGRGIPPQIVALSAVIGQTHGLEDWFGGGLLRTEERPVPLRERVLDASGSLRTLEPNGEETTEPRAIAPEFVGGSQSSKPYVIPLVRHLVGEGKKVIVFRAVKVETVGTAGYLAQALGLPPATDVLDALPGSDLSDASQQLRNVLGAGVGFHNADLDRDERTALEDAFRDPASPLRVLVSTTTLAMGINTPVEAVVIVGLVHPPSQPYTVAEYKNMAGRAGRLGHADAGEAYIIATAEPSPYVAWQNYVLGSPDDVVSRFLDEDTDPQTLILRSLLALGASVDEAQLIDLLENSFAMWQRTQAGHAQGWDVGSLRHDLDALVSGQLIDREPDGRLTLTELGRYASESGIEVRSVTQVASLLRYAPDVLSPPALVVLAQVTLELDALRIRTHTRSRQEQARWPRVLMNLGVPGQLLRGLHIGGGVPLVREKRAAACLLFMSAIPMANVEAELLQHTPERSASGPIRQVAARTRDVIGVVANIANYYGKTLADDAAVDDLLLQLELGVPRELLPLASELGSQLTRGDYLALLDAGIVGWELVDAADNETLANLLGPAKSDLLKRRAAATGEQETALASTPLDGAE
jgi:helicase